MTKFLIAAILFCIAPALAGERATLKSCYAARDIAMKNDNKWNAPFSPMDCKTIEARSLKAEFVLMNPQSKKKDIAKAAALLDQLGGD